ncbi:MAG: hypothetical protein NTW86_04875 [Candidatus Sumerlaeota bacterium]|nr:hypothetical protein [Candidatus Sumerlaeota bacterium]
MHQPGGSYARLLPWAALTAAVLVGVAACARAAPPKEKTVSPAIRGKSETAPPRQRSGEAIVAFPQSFNGTLKAMKRGGAATSEAAIVDGRASLPAGEYMMFYVDAEQRDAQGTLWTAKTAFSKDIDLAPGAVTSLPGGPPFAASAKADGPAGREKISLALVDAGNHPVSFYKAGSRVDPPKFEIVDASGKAVFASSFSYG